EGAVPQAAVDEAVRRVLRLKLRLGLFEHPYVDAMLAEQIILRDDHRSIALDVARESMVLLKNERGARERAPLPLVAGAARVAVIGPLAHNRGDLLGSWAMYGRAEDAETVLEGIGVYVKGADALTYAQGCTISGTEANGIPAAVAAALAADVVVLVLGE